MPPKARITREMVVDAAFGIVRSEGADKISARTVAQALDCSTQPVMYHFAKIEDMKRAVYDKLDRYHTEYIMNISGEDEDALLGIGLNYIRFAIEEPRLFKFLFQSGFAVEHSLLEMVDSDELTPVISAMREAMGTSEAQTKHIFVTIALFAHGYASILANNSLMYDEALVTAHLERAYRGALLTALEDAEAEGDAANKREDAL